MDINVISQVLTSLVGSLGFPIVACGYMMVKMNKTIEENTKATNNLCNLVTALIGHKDSEVHEDNLSYKKDDAE